MEIVQPVFTELLWLVVGGFLGCLAAVAGGVLAARRDPRAIVLVVSAPSLVVVSVVVGGLAGLYNPDVHTGVAAALLLRMIGVVALVPLASTLALVLSALAWSDGSRMSFANLAPLGLVVVAAVATVVEGSMGGNLVLGGVRAGVYGVVGMAGSLAFASRRRDLALGAALAWAMVVGLVEGASRALVGFMALTASVRMIGVQKRPEGLDAMVASVQTEVPYGVAAVGVAVALVVGVAVRLGWRERSGVPAIVALLSVVVWGGYAVGLPDLQTLIAAAVAAP